LQGVTALEFAYRTYDSSILAASPSELKSVLASNILVLTQQMAAVEQLPRLTAVRRQGRPVRGRGGREGLYCMRRGQEAS
jgi:hypothetical protein